MRLTVIQSLGFVFSILILMGALFRLQELDVPLLAKIMVSLAIMIVVIIIAHILSRPERREDES